MSRVFSDGIIWMRRIPMKRTILLALSALAVGMLACVSNATQPTQVIVTQVIVIPNATTQATAGQPMPTAPLPSATGISTATVIPTSTLSGPTATFIKNANCRAGPSTTFDAVTSFYKGETVQIVGRNPDFNNTWWYVLIPSGGKCWVSLTTAQATGPFDDIPTITP